MPVLPDWASVRHWTNQPLRRKRNAMYPVIRLLTSTVRAMRATPLAYDGVSEISFVCRPWDIDMFGEVNNGRQLTLYDLGRFDLAWRCGLVRVLRDRHWGLTVAGSSARYRKRIRMFDRVTMRTKALGYDERWIYLAQSMTVKGEPASALLVRTCVTAKGRTVPTNDVRHALGDTNWQPVLPDWVRRWDEADKERPWPPVP
jgi:acyl-CoA thioesterase FadM